MWRRANKVSTIQALLRALQVLTIVRKNVCNKAKKRKVTFWVFEKKRKISILERFIFKKLYGSVCFKFHYRQTERQTNRHRMTA